MSEHKTLSLLTFLSRPVNTMNKDGRFSCTYFTKPHLFLLDDYQLFVHTLPVGRPGGHAGIHI
jgi:hypothetical protein